MENESTPLAIDVSEAIGSLAVEAVRLDACVRELAEANRNTMGTLTAMTNTLEKINDNHAIAFRRIKALLISVGADCDGLAVRELEHMFDLPSETDKTN